MQDWHAWDAEAPEDKKVSSHKNNNKLSFSDSE